MQAVLDPLLFRGEGLITIVADLGRSQRGEREPGEGAPNPWFPRLTPNPDERWDHGS
jgi:hypothetical protein